MALPPQLFVNITSPSGQLPFVDRTFQIAGQISWIVPSNYTLTSRSASVQFGPGGPTVGGTFTNISDWQCTGTVSNSVSWGQMVELSVHAQASFRFFIVPGEPDVVNLNVSTTFVVRLLAAFPLNLTIDDFASPIVAAQLPVSYAFTGSASGPQGAIQLVQYKVENGQFANAVDVSGNWSQWRVILPLPPTTPDKDHVLTIRATDQWGTVGEISKHIAVQPQTPIVVPPGAQTTLTGAPTTSSITSWTRLEPHCTDADMATSTSARLFDPLWMLTRQWQMGEFQAEDAGTPIQARVRSTTAMLTRCYSGELPKPAAGTPAIAAPAYDPTRTPLEVMVERRRMRAVDPNEARMLTFAVEAGLHFLRMLELQPLSKSYRSVFLIKLALQPLSAASAALVDDATARYVQSMVGRTPDGRQLAALLRTTGAAQLAVDPALKIATADRAEVQQAATAWLAWYDSMYSEPTGQADDAWNPSRLEYALSVGTRLSANTQDDITFSANEVDGPIDWSSFDINQGASLTTNADQSFTALVEASIPAPINFPGSPAPRFWEMEDASVAYGLVPVGPTDLAHLMMIEYASSYGNDWFAVPLTLPVGSVTRVDSLVVTDTFGVRSLVRPIGDPALPPAYFSLWQSAYQNPDSSGAVKIATNRFFLPPTLSRTMDGAPLEDVLFVRDEMANLAWAIERTVESPIEQPAPRYEAADAAPSDPAAGAPTTDFPRYLLSSQVAPNWIPLLPVQLPNPSQPPNTAGQIISRLKRGAVLQPDGTKKVHSAMGEVLNAGSQLLLYDEEVPREGVHVTRQRRLTRWTDGSTWLWTSFRNRVGCGEGSSALKFDQVLGQADGQSQ